MATLMLGCETILLVEDDLAVRDLTREVLEENGYQVLVASHGREALAVAHRHDGDIDLVLTDVVMPVMNGQDLVRHLVWTRPRARVIYTSGYTDHTAVQTSVLESAPAFLQKPYTPDRLLHAVRESLDAPAAR